MMTSGRATIRVESPGFNPTAMQVAYDANRPGLFNTTLNLGSVSESVMVTAEATPVATANIAQLEARAKKEAQAAQNAPSSNVMNLQRRVSGVLPIAIDVPHAGTAFHFVRPLVVDEETKVTFTYRSK